MSLEKNLCEFFVWLPMADEFQTTRLPSNILGIPYCVLSKKLVPENNCYEPSKCDVYKNYLFKRKS